MVKTKWPLLLLVTKKVTLLWGEPGILCVMTPYLLNVLSITVCMAKGLQPHHHHTFPTSQQETLQALQAHPLFAC